MRTFQVAAGAIFLADGLTALLGGKRLAQRVYSFMSERCPKCCRDSMKEFADIDPRVLTAWGVNNALAGSLMILTGLADGCCGRGSAGQHLPEQGIPDQGIT